MSKLCPAATSLMLSPEFICHTASNIIAVAIPHLEMTKYHRHAVREMLEAVVTGASECPADANSHGAAPLCALALPPRHLTSLHRDVTHFRWPT